MPKKLNIPLALLVLGIITSLALHKSLLGDEIRGWHSWRQAQSMCNIRNFERHDANIMNPRLSRFNSKKYTNLVDLFIKNQPTMFSTLQNLPKTVILFFLLLFAASTTAQDGTIYPLNTPAEPNAIPLGTGGVENQPAAETWFRQWGDPMARNITTATLTPFLPKPGQANGATVIVAPGGGFRWLSMGNEGWEVAEALAAQGVTAFVLKYRLHPTPVSLDDFSNWMKNPFPPPVKSADSTQAVPPPRPPQMNLSNQLEDAEAAYAMIVKRAKEWGVDTSRIGMIGFSAGAGLTMHATLNSKTMDLAFIGPIYGGMGPVEVPKNAPPMFNVIATDDFLFKGQFGVVDSWYKAGIPVEFHLYQNGGHGFGLGNPNRTSNRWFDAFMHWLDVNGFLAAKSGKSGSRGSPTSGKVTIRDSDVEKLTEILDKKGCCDKSFHFQTLQYKETSVTFAISVKRILMIHLTK